MKTHTMHKGGFVHEQLEAFPPSLLFNFWWTKNRWCLWSMKQGHSFVSRSSIKVIYNCQGHRYIRLNSLVHNYMYVMCMSVVLKYSILWLSLSLDEFHGGYCSPMMIGVAWVFQNLNSKEWDRLFIMKWV